jgi:hypothetical protein
MLLLIISIFVSAALALLAVTAWIMFGSTDPIKDFDYRNESMRDYQ